MKKPSEMTNAELAEWLSSDIDMMATGPNRYASNLTEAAKRLRAMPEPPKPEFFVGWKGKTVGGSTVEIMGKVETNLIGSMGAIGAAWDENGEYLHRVSKDNDLVSNTQEPEIWWRAGGDSRLYRSREDLEAHTVPIFYQIEKVEVRVVG